MVLTRMEWDAHSAARDLASWATAALEALGRGQHLCSVGGTAGEKTGPEGSSPVETGY